MRSGFGVTVFIDFIYVNTTMDVEDLRIYLEVCPDCKERDALQSILDFIEKVKDQADATKKFDAAMKGTGLT